MVWGWAKTNEGLLVGFKSLHLPFAAPPNFHCVTSTFESAVDRAPRQWRIKEGADWATARSPQQIRGPQSLRWWKSVICAQYTTRCKRYHRQLERVACGNEDLTQHTMSTGSLVPILVLFTSKVQVRTFWYIPESCAGQNFVSAPALHPQNLNQSRTRRSLRNLPAPAPAPQTIPTSARPALFLSQTRTCPKTTKTHN